MQDCSAFVDWLDKEGLLTDAKQSRNPDGNKLVSLDDLRGGNAGEKVPREAYKD